MSPRVFCGTFEAEAHLRPGDLAALPAIKDGDSSRIVEAMDELLFAFCGPSDRVVTVRRMEGDHIDYLHSVGFQFIPNPFDLPHQSEEPGDGHLARLSVFDRMLDNTGYENLKGFLPSGTQFEPFAVLSKTSAVADRFGLIGNFPALDIVRKVNAKFYSLEMRDRLQLPNVGLVVDSVASFLDTGRILLRQGPVLVKDDYGVSGKGNLRVESERVLVTIGRYLSAQVARGCRIGFIMEPYLRKSADFSCQFRIATNGKVDVISVQELENNGHAFGTSRSPRPELTHILDKHDYRGLMVEVASRMHEDGYYGDVCVDSMVLEDGSLAPLVEINARRSMSLIKHAVDEYLAQHCQTGCLTSVSGIHDGTGDFGQFIGVLNTEGLLYTRQNPAGVIPLTCRTMFACSDSGGTRSTRGRLYVIAVGTTEQQRATLTRLESILPKCGVRVLH